MKKYLLATGFLILSLLAQSQDAGYRTTDVGAAYQYTPDYHSYSLHLGFNAEENHSFILRASYTSALNQSTSLHNRESGHGWGAYLGYRYHFSVIPKRFFLGLGLGIQSADIHWSNTLLEGDSKKTVLQPTVETGYTLVINDYMYITPSLSGILQTKLSSSGAEVKYGSDFLPGFGISLGWRF